MMPKTSLLLMLLSSLACAACESPPKPAELGGDDASASSGTPASAKDESDAAKAVAALEQVPKMQHVALAGMALSEFAADRLPGELTKGLKTLGQVDDKMGRTLAAATLADPRP